jgi:hypothetical protein
VGGYVELLDRRRWRRVGETAARAPTMVAEEGGWERKGGEEALRK